MYNPAFFSSLIPTVVFSLPSPRSFYSILPSIHTISKAHSPLLHSPHHSRPFLTTITTPRAYPSPPPFPGQWAQSP
ncbi:hypothetical protein FPQ18DRAFT_101743 [Pyronema domesticum]|nr:hypothetical protein FPQ18DRAFT_101743 [Pyronema domesticum]